MWERAPDVWEGTPDVREWTPDVREGTPDVREGIYIYIYICMYIRANPLDQQIDGEKARDRIVYSVWPGDPRRV